MKSFLSYVDFAQHGKIARKITAIYVFIGLIWIFISHGMANILSGDLAVRFRLEATFDLLTVAITSAILYWAVRRILEIIDKQENKLHDLVEAVCSASDDSFFQTLVCGLAETLDADYAFICKYTDKNRKTVETVAVCADGEIIDNFQFDLAGTPCEKVVSTGLKYYAQGVRNKFPLDHLALKMGVESYVGIPLRDSHGRVIGPMAVFGRKTLHKKRQAESMLQLFAVRAAAELERKQAEKTIDYMAFYDALTGLPNRRMYGECLAKALAHAEQSKEKLAVIILDLDRFKNVNDSLGHALGDHLLKKIAERMTSSLPKQVMVARMGGDEFMLLLPGIKEIEDAGSFASRDLECLKAPFHIEQQELHVTFSLGIALYPYDGTDTETLIKNADTALNRAKEKGKNDYQFYTSDMNALSLARLGLENSLRRALEREEFRLYYQPQYKLATRQLIGLEALIRWQHPERGIVSPVEFISIAEETGLIVPIGNWVLETACNHIKTLQNSGYNPLRVAVNLSAIQFYQKNLVEDVKKAIKKTGLDPASLELEITESLIMQDVAETIEKLKRLRNLGIRISIDDFGTGYSSLSYLKKFPINTLKIDRSFVSDIGEDSDDTAIVSTIIDLAKNMEMEVIAEGVENREQLDFLINRQSDMAQGFLFSPPLPFDKLEKYLKNNFKVDFL